jgi:hypothetical protein
MAWVALLSKGDERLVLRGGVPGIEGLHVRKLDDYDLSNGLPLAVYGCRPLLDIVRRALQSLVRP